MSENTLKLTSSVVVVPTEKRYHFDVHVDEGTYTVEVDTTARYGYFEHNELGDESGGGLWFDGKNLIDYDGVFELPMKVIKALRAAGFSVSKDFE